jgi:hypothetical protein
LVVLFRPSRILGRESPSKRRITRNGTAARFERARIRAQPAQGATQRRRADQYCHVRENMTEEELDLFDILTRPAPELSRDERAEVKKVARELLNRLKQLLVLNWRQKSSARSQIKLTIEDVLDTLPAAYDRPLYAQKCSALFGHMYESYPERDANVYVTAV